MTSSQSLPSTSDPIPHAWWTEPRLARCLLPTLRQKHPFSVERIDHSWYLFAYPIPAEREDQAAAPLQPFLGNRVTRAREVTFDGISTVQIMCGHMANPATLLFSMWLMYFVWTRHTNNGPPVLKPGISSTIYYKLFWPAKKWYNFGIDSHGRRSRNAAAYAHVARIVHNTTLGFAMFGLAFLGSSMWEGTFMPVVFPGISTALGLPATREEAAWRNSLAR